MEWIRGKFKIVDDSTEIDIDVVLRLLAGTYWGPRRPRTVIEKLIRHSLCFSLFCGQEQIGFARVATDYTVFSWLSDIVIADEYRNRGLGQWLIDAILNHPATSQTQFVLQTRHAHRLYEKCGFQVSGKLMMRLPPPDNGV